MTEPLMLLGAARAAEARALAAAGFEAACYGALAAALAPASSDARERIVATAAAARAVGAFAPVQGGRFSPEAARAWLRSEQDALTEALDRLADCAEWVLTFAPRPEAQAAPIAHGGAWLRARAAALRAEAALRRDAESRAMAALGPLARAALARGFATPAGRGVDVAVLAPREAAAAMGRAADSLGAALSGPWPAFSFVRAPAEAV